MTYQQLLDELKKLDSEQLQMDVTVYNDGDEEFIPVNAYRIINEDDEDSDILGVEHPYLVF